SFTLMDEDSVRKTVAQGKFIRFASNPNISLKWLAGGDGSEQSPHILEASVPDASTSQKGVSQLSSSTTSTSEAQSATPKAVKLAKEQAISTSVNSAKAYTNQEVAKVTGAPGAHASIKELSDAVVSNDQDIAQIEQTLPTKADKSTPLNTSGAITGGGNVGDGLTIGIKDATTGQKGAVQLSSSVSSTSQAHAATPSAVKIAYDLAKSKWAFQPASATVAGATKLSSAVNSVDETLAATPKAVKSAYDLAASKWTYQTATTARIGAVQLSSRVDLADETRAATPKAVKSAYDLAASKWAYKVATLTQAGAVQLSSATDSIDETMAATPKAVKSAHDLAARKWVFVPASKTVAGAVKLSSAINSTSVTYAATPKAVKTAYDLAASKWTHRVATTTQTGTVQLSSSVSSTSETLAATPKAVKTAHDRAVTGEQAAKAYADNLVSQLLGDAPAEHLNTLKELGDALTNNDSDIAAINAELAKKASKAIQITVSGALTGGGDLSGNVALGVQTATTGRPGVAQLSSSVTSTSETLAATPKAVKTAHDKATNALNVANSKWTHRSATTSQTGTTQLSSAVNSTSESLAATPKAIKTAYDLAASKITKAQGDGWWLPKDGTAENAKLLDG
ncbi:MAG: tail fiber protein, partial [Pseudomonadota bacterium]